MITDSAIRTCRNADDVDYKFYVVEQNKKCKPYKNAVTIYYDFKFNYNMCLNLGIIKGNSPYVALCNNDLIFYKDWGMNILRGLQRFESVSPSPKPFPGFIKGYEVEKQVLGWCIVAHRDMLVDKLNLLDAPVYFWYSDNVYALQLKRAGVVHALAGESTVRHLTSVTLHKMPQPIRKYYMKDQYKLFIKYKNDTSIKMQVPGTGDH